MTVHPERYWPTSKTTPPESKIPQKEDILARSHGREVNLEFANDNEEQAHQSKSKGGKTPNTFWTYLPRLPFSDEVLVSMALLQLLTLKTNFTFQSFYAGIGLLIGILSTGAVNISNLAQSSPHQTWSRLTKVYLVACMLFALHVKYDEGLLLQPSQTDIHGVAMRNKPSIALIVFDANVLESMDSSLFWRKAGFCVPWEHHDAGAFTREQGFASLLYGIRGLNDDDLLFFEENDAIKSWPMSVLQSNGYHTRRIISSWDSNEPSTLQLRGFNSVQIVSEGQSPLNGAMEWVTSNKKGPFFLSLDVIEPRGNQLDETLLLDFLDDLHSDSDTISILTSYHTDCGVDCPQTKVPLTMCGNRDVVQRAAGWSLKYQVFSHADLFLSVIRGCRAFVEEDPILGEATNGSRGLSYTRHPQTNLEVLHFDADSFLLREGSATSIMHLKNSNSGKGAVVESLVQLMDHIRDDCRWPGYSPSPKKGEPSA